MLACEVLILPKTALKSIGICRDITRSGATTFHDACDLGTCLFDWTLQHVAPTSTHASCVLVLCMMWVVVCNPFRTWHRRNGIYFSKTESKAGGYYEDAYRFKRATLDLSPEAEKGVLCPSNPWCYILLTTSVSTTNHMGYMATAKSLGQSITPILDLGSA